MNGVSGRSVRVLRVTLAAFMLLTLQSFGAVQATVLDSSQSIENPVQSSLFGRSLLVEEITATWCPSCSELDPYLMSVADSHGSRIAMVAYHPSDGEDAFQPAASQHRIDRLSMVHQDIGSTPTFLVEGKNPRIGPESWSDVQRDILDLEIQRQDTSMLQFEIVQNGSIVNAKVLSFSSLDGNLSGTQLTFLVVEHGKQIPPDAINPGGGSRDRVVVATAECSFDNSSITAELGLISSNVVQSCEEDFEISFEHMDEFSLLLLHEHSTESIQSAEQLGTLGVVEFAYRSRNIDSSWTASYLILPIMIGAGILAILPQKKGMMTGKRREAANNYRDAEE